MKTYTIRTLLTVMFVFGLICWFFFVPVQVEVPASVPGWAMDGAIPVRGDRIKVIQFYGSESPGLWFKTQRATFIRMNDDDSMVTIAMSRWDYCWFGDSDHWWYLDTDETLAID